MAEPSKYTIHTEVNQIIETNTGTVIGKGDQHNYAPEQNLAEAAKEIQQLLNQLAQTYPTATAAEVPNIMKTELARMECNQPEKWAALRRDLLNKERWFQGGKAAVTEVTKQLADKSVVVKGAIAFLEGFSKDVG